MARPQLVSIVRESVGFSLRSAVHPSPTILPIPKAPHLLPKAFRVFLPFTAAYLLSTSSEAYYTGYISFKEYK